MPGKAHGTSPLFHPRFMQVTNAGLQLLPDPPFVVSKQRPVVVVELLDNLIRPSALQDIPPDELGLQPISDRVVAGVPQFVAGLTKQQVGVPHQLMECVQLTACAFDVLQSLGNRADGFHCRLVQLGGPILGYVRQVLR